MNKWIIVCVYVFFSIVKVIFLNYGVNNFRGELLVGGEFKF